VLQLFAERLGTANLDAAAGYAEQLINDLLEAERARKNALRKIDRLEKQNRPVF